MNKVKNFQISITGFGQFTSVGVNQIFSLTTCFSQKFLQNICNKEKKRKESIDKNKKCTIDEL